MPSTRPHRHFLFDTLDCGLQRSGAPSRLVLHSLDSLQQGRHVGHHHLTETQKNTNNEKMDQIVHSSQYFTAKDMEH